MMAHCSRSVARTAVFLAVLAVVSMLLPITVRANGADIYKKIKPSLALVIVPQADGRQVAFGTAFCVASSADSSTFLTSRHVIEGGTRYFLLLQGNNTPIEATILRKGEGDNDVAALTVHRGGFMPLALDGDLPAEGTTIAIAGYPATQLELARAHLGLAPSVHEGTVSAIVAQGFLILHDAQQEHGNSGGPLFDANTGAVYGIVTESFKPPGTIGTNAAISIRGVRGFMGNIQVPTGLGSLIGLMGYGATNAACVRGMQVFAKAAADWDTSSRRAIATVTSSVQPIMNRWSQVSPRQTRDLSGDLASLLGDANTQVQEVQKDIEPQLDIALSDLNDAKVPETMALIQQMTNDMKSHSTYYSTYLESWHDNAQHYANTGRMGGPPIDSGALQASKTAYDDLMPGLQALWKLPPCTK